MMETNAQVCYRHQDRTTYLRCSRCNRPICPQCSTDTPVGQRCPECSPAGARPRVVRTGRIGRATTPAVLALIIVTVAVYLLQRVFPTEVLNNFAHATWLVSNGEWWRGITAAFLHDQGFFLHILFNMYFLYILGPRIEQQVGTPAFLGLYFGSAAGGAVAFQYLTDGFAVAVGASGAIFGLLGAAVLGSFRMRNTPQGSAVFRQLLFVLAINLALPLFISRIAWQAHLGGLVAGVVITAIWQRIPPGSRLGVARTTTALAVLVIGLALLWIA